MAKRANSLAFFHLPFSISHQAGIVHRPELARLAAVPDGR
jgi:hypothetical protein